MNRLEYLSAPFEREREYLERRAAEGIEARKAAGKLLLRQKDGARLAGAQIRLRQTSHKFLHGGNIFMLEELETPEKNALYREDFDRAFNLATLPFYWADLEPHPGALRFKKDSERIYRRPVPDLCLEYCREKGITPKLHCLNYDQWSPAWLDPHDVEKVKRLLEKRIAEIAARYGDAIHCMEVINETLCGPGDWPAQGRHSTDFFWADDLIEWSFACARKYLPRNELIINEATGDAWNVYQRSRSRYSMVIERALKNGASIDGIGLQYHLFHRLENEEKETCPLLSPQRLYACMDHYWNRFHLPLQVTEITLPAYSVSAQDVAAQALLMEKLYTIWFSHPAMEAAIYWNLVDGYAAFAPQGDMTAGENYFYGGLLRFDFSKKPAYDMLVELFQHRWRTELTLTADGQGCAEFRGFEGDYAVEIVKNGHTAPGRFRLEKDAGTAEIVVEE